MEFIKLNKNIIKQTGAIFDSIHLNKDFLYEHFSKNSEKKLLEIIYGKKYISTGVIWDKYNNNFLLGKRSLKETHAPGALDIIGGKAKSKESIISCLIREFNEEIGVTKINILSLIGYFEIFYKSEWMTEFVFLVEILDAIKINEKELDSIITINLDSKNKSYLNLFHSPGESMLFNFCQRTMNEGKASFN